MPAFPSLTYSESGYSYEVAPAVVRTEFASKTARQRKIYKKRDDIFSVSLRLSGAELATFEEFVRDDISNGADLFTAPYYASDVESSGDAYILNGQYRVNYVAPDIWDVFYSLEIKDRDMTDGENIYLVVQDLAGFDDLGAIFDALENMVNNNNL
jgi:hypothetical protein